MNKVFNDKKGSMLITVLLVSILFFFIAMGLINLGFLRERLNKQLVAKQQSLHIAEAGANYYRWHLAHDQTDYYDGTGADPGPAGEPYGPYEHTYQSPSGDITGKFSLEITPPPTGSTIVTISSTGWVDEYPNIKRTVEVLYGIPSLAHYSFLTNSNAWFSGSETVRGELHSNNGIRMDGLNDSLVSSARTTYVCDLTNGCDSLNCNIPCTWTGSDCECPGVWGTGPNNALWSYPVPNVDFSAITADLAQIKADAQSSGIYISKSNKEGYHVIFKSDGTLDISEVLSLGSPIQQFYPSDGWKNEAEEIDTEDAATNYTIPANGIIYIEDHVWVEGNLNGRVTLAAANLPDQVNKRKSIIINGDLTYIDRDGTHILGLIAQNNIKVPSFAPTDLTIDAILLAQNGQITHNYYSPVNFSKNSIEVYGGILTNKVWTWTWASGGVTEDGYENTTSIYDTSATYAPPPSFPTSGEYTFISWNEK